ncbi:unnamed protein product [Linum trigynum]|uniref:Uncharacterized protein n=1 Tax=Linum trigynum TaxID=586398 RepID=A0AAV2DLT0_9ROSI
MERRSCRFSCSKLDFLLSLDAMVSLLSFSLASKLFYESSIGWLAAMANCIFSPYHQLELYIHTSQGMRGMEAIYIQL